MRKIYILLILCLQLKFAFTQETKTLDKSIYKVMYLYKYQKDSISQIYNYRMELLKGKKYSLFQSLNTKFNDSLFNANEKGISSASESSEIVSILFDRKRDYLKYKILKNNNHVTTYDIIMRDRYVYDETTNYDWKILKDTLTINSYKCYKATMNFSGRDYVAWFTKEIPISDGPYKFNGLPGLIIKIYDTKKAHIFELEGFVKKVEPIILYKDILFGASPRQKVTKKGYFNAIKNFKANPITYMISIGRVINDENRQEQHERILRNAKRYKSNAIELKLE